MDRVEGIISIHAPVKGATLHRRVLAIDGRISIHAPVKGATCSLIVVISGALDFNPRSREGSDVAPVLLSVLWTRFQSTLP